MNLFLSVWRAMPRLCCVALAVFGATVARADGMVPDTSVVIVNEADGEATVSVTNTDNKMALLHVTLENIPEDSDTLLFVTPPLTRVEASKSQLVRFILQTQAPLQTQRLKRAIFEGMPAQRWRVVAAGLLNQIATQGNAGHVRLRKMGGLKTRAV